MSTVALPPLRWSIAALWAACAALVFVVTDASSLRAWMALAVTAFLPPAILIRMWTDGPPQTVAEVLYDTERRP